MLAALATALLGLAVSASPTPTSPAPHAITLQDPQVLARKVQGFYERTRDLEARFQQTYTYSGFGRRQNSSGVLKVKKPGMMRWDYEKPSPKTVAVKGKRLVQFEPGENQAFVDEAFDSSAMSAAVTFLLGKGNLLQEFDASVDGGGDLVLRPKEPDPRVETITLAVTGDGQVVATRVVDGAGNVNEIRFDQVKRNIGIPDTAFDVALPADVTLVKPPGK